MSRETIVVYTVDFTIAEERPQSARLLVTSWKTKSVIPAGMTLSASLASMVAHRMRETAALCITKSSRQ
jgi:hypothetical protein